MTRFILFFFTLIVSVSCKSSQQTLSKRPIKRETAQTESLRQAETPKTSPGAVSVKLLIIEKKDAHQYTGEIVQVIGSGSGFNKMLSKGDRLELTNVVDKLNITSGTTYRFELLPAWEGTYSIAKIIE